MSLVISFVTPEYLVQVSDTRISYPSSTWNKQRKSLLLLGDHARVAVGWVGLAVIRWKSTADWLADQLTDMHAASLPLHEVVRLLAERSTATFGALTTTEKRCSFVLAGWFVREGSIEPVVVSLSNCEERPGGRTLPEARAEFHFGALTSSKSRPAKRPSVILISGWDPVAADFRPYFLGLRKLAKRGVASTCIRNVCVDIARRAAQRYGDATGPIGTRVIAVEMHRDSGPQCWFYAGADDSPEVLTPDVITPTVAIRDIRLWSGATPPPWWTG